MPRKLRYVVARILEARAAAARHAGRTDDAVRLARRAEEIFQSIDALDRRPKTEARAEAGAPHAR